MSARAAMTYHAPVTIDSTRVVAVVLCILSEAARHGASLTIDEVEAVAYLSDRDALDVTGVAVTGDSYVATIRGPRGIATSALLRDPEARVPWACEDVPGRGPVMSIPRSVGRSRATASVLTQADVDAFAYVTRSVLTRRVVDVRLLARVDAAYRAARLGRRAGAGDPAIDLSTPG